MTSADRLHDQHVQKIRALLSLVRTEGRRVLVVIGAGCSHGSGMPLMIDVYRYLAKKIEDKIQQVENGRHLRMLSDLFKALEVHQGPRSLAARALGLCQNAHLLEDQDERRTLQHIWTDFATDFLTWKVRKPPVKPSKPTVLGAPSSKFHAMVADWVQADLAVPMSLNFDGLTRKAIKSTSGKCVILTNADEIRRHWARPDPASLPSVIKIWGDVFHASCSTPGCPSEGKTVALYELSDKGKAKQILACPDCGDARQLQIFFTGYQKKEDDAEDLLNAIRTSILPGIGGVITVGVSGRWDAPLLHLLQDAGRYTQRDDDKGKARVLCIDCDKSGEPFLVSQLCKRSVAAEHIPRSADELATSLGTLPDPWRACGRGTVPTNLPSHPIDWSHVLFRGKWCMRPKALEDVIEVDSTEFGRRFRQIRQLGLKTAVMRGAGAAEHNRMEHSRATAHIAMEWLTRLLGTKTHLVGTSVSADASLSIVYLAGLMHDLNHLPFTHLTEEVYAELNWSSSPWSKSFSHDMDAIRSCHTSLQEWALATIHKVARKLEVDERMLEMLVTRTIEGRSGMPALDAILNSPIDADKLEYLASDCAWMEQEVRIAFRETPAWNKWVSDFFNDQIILPSGVLAISGRGGEHAHELLLERRWLYKHLYFRPGFRVLERVFRHLLVRWLIWKSNDQMADDWSKSSLNLGGNDQSMYAALRIVPVNDTRSVKGRVGAQLLWNRLIPPTGNALTEPDLAKAISKDLEQRHQNTNSSEWYTACHSMLEHILDGTDVLSYAEFEDRLKRYATWSPRMYVDQKYRADLTEVIRELEFASDQLALIDVAAVPRMLSYPSARETRRRGNKPPLYSDCWVVPHRDPDRWGRNTGRWMPLSETALAEHDRQRWAQVLIVSPRKQDDPALQHVEDRFRWRCGQLGIEISDNDPEEA